MKTNQWPWWLIVASFLSLLCCQTTSGKPSRATISKSTVGNLRDRGIYIIHFKNNATEIKLQHFTAVLERKSNKKHFVAEIIENFFTIKCLTAKLSKRALQWVTSQEIVMSVKENEYILIGSQNTIKSNSSQIQSSWHLDKIGQIALSNNTTNGTLTGKGVDVYVLDSGIHYEHEEFNGRALYPGCDPIDKILKESRAGRDCEGHGTHVAGLVGGNSTGVASGVTLFSVRVLNCALKATEASIMHGLMCVVNHSKSRNGTRAVINLSVAGAETSLAINKSLQLVLDNNIIITASAGNGDSDFRYTSYNSCKAYPAGYPGIINVGATDIHDNALMGKFDNEVYITNMGECLDVFAPGYNIISSDMCSLELCHNQDVGFINGLTYDNSCKRVRSGTSQSTPIVTGAVALLLQKCPNITHTEIKLMLRHLLSKSKVKFCNTFNYLKKESILLDVVVTVMNTRDRLLHLQNLTDIEYCSVFKGRPL